jgi:hypothetical protein
MVAAFVRKTFLFEKRFGDLIHRYLVVCTREEMSVAIRGDLQGCVTGESLHHVECKSGLDPSRHSEVSQRVPIEAHGRRFALEQRQELPLD